jgi:uncharacterized membrane protein (DUF106 family)
MRQEIEHILLIVGIFFFIAPFFPEFRIEIGSGVNYLLGPMLAVLPFHVVVLIMASITGVYAAVIQKYSINWELTKKVQSRVKAFQKEMKEAMASQNKFKLKKLESEKAEIMKEQMEMSRQQFKPTFYIVIVSMPIFLWLWWYMYIASPVLPALKFPLLGSRSMMQITLGMFPYWIVWYMLCSLPVGQLFKKVLGVGGAY